MIPKSPETPEFVVTKSMACDTKQNVISGIIKIDIATFNTNTSITIMLTVPYSRITKVRDLLFN